ncbi:MAG: nitroreductase [Bacteroidota bacterium]
MNQVDRLIRQNRRSVFPQFFTDKEIPADVLSQILENANWAPSHRHTEPWRFVVFQAEGKHTLADQVVARYRAAIPVEKQDEKKVAKTRKKLGQSAAVIGIVMHRDPEERVPEWEEIAAVSMAVQNLWLSLEQHGLGGYWSSPGFLTKEYGLMPWTAENERCLGLFYLGYHEAPELPRQRGGIDKKVEYVNS